MTLYALDGKAPVVTEAAFVAPDAVLIGNWLEADPSVAVGARQ